MPIRVNLREKSGHLCNMFEEEHLPQEEAIIRALSPLFKIWSFMKCKSHQGAPRF